MHIAKSCLQTTLIAEAHRTLLVKSTRPKIFSRSQKDGVDDTRIYFLMSESFLDEMTVCWWKTRFRCNIFSHHLDILIIDCKIEYRSSSHKLIFLPWPWIYVPIPKAYDITCLTKQHFHILTWRWALTCCRQSLGRRTSMSRRIKTKFHLRFRLC